MSAVTSNGGGGTPAYVTQTAYAAAEAQLAQLNQEITIAQATVSQDTATIAALKTRIAALKPTTGTTTSPGISGSPTLVSTSEVYVSNINSCHYKYNIIGHYSNGTTKVIGSVIKQEGICASLPTVKYTFRKYVSNVDSIYYTYAIIAVYTNGTEKQIGTVVVKK